MVWSWSYEDAAGEAVGQSQEFDSRGDAESWVGEAFADLVDEGVDQVRLLEDGTEVYGPMSLHP